jgi:signal transduction histidine kinase
MTGPPPEPDGTVTGLARFRAVAARLTRPGRPAAPPETGEPATEPGAPAAEPGTPGEEPEPGPAGPAPVQDTVVPDLETVAPGPEPGTPGERPEPGPAGPAPVPDTVVPDPEPDPWLAVPAPARPPVPVRAIPGMRSWARPQQPASQARPPLLPRPAAAERASAMAARFAGGWPFGRVIGVGVLIVAVFSLLAIGVGGTALADLTNARERVVNTLDPAAYHAAQLEVELLNQETGVRGYALSAQLPLLLPYNRGYAGQQAEAATLRRLLAGMPGAMAELGQVLRRAGAWRATYALPTINRVRDSGRPVTGAPTGQGKAAFDQIRAAMAALQATLARQRQQAAGTLSDAASVLDATLIVIAVALLAAVLVLGFGLWRSAILPLSRLAADARQVAEGDFEHQVEPGGPAEMRAVGLDVNRMRERILAELSALQAAHAALEARTEDLQRSNSELEQFAYVASHDLQEPLRKVASFCQLLQRRYAGRLDAKADEYIEHAVDGAKRMQELINDLLAFSRVGRAAQHREPVSCAVLLAQAWANLAADVRRTQATIEVGELPVVLGEASLLTAVFQNLINNALKFRADEPPRVTVSARRDGGFWLFSFGDNGIGIEPEYAERIFVIFQRLHDKATYPGTGIGLAMVRKIIEYHGGRIWLDTTITAGARFWFTLPALPEDEDEHADE